MLESRSEPSEEYIWKLIFDVQKRAPAIKTPLEGLLQGDKKPDLIKRICKNDSRKLEPRGMPWVQSTQ